MREGIRREKATSGCGSSAMEVNEERVAPWKRELEGSACGVDGLASAGMSEVTTATGCAVSRSRARRSRRVSSPGLVLLEVARARLEIFLQLLLAQRHHARGSILGPV